MSTNYSFSNDQKETILTKFYAIQSIKKGYYPTWILEQVSTMINTINNQQDLSSQRAEFLFATYYPEDEKDYKKRAKFMSAIYVIMVLFYLQLPTLPIEMKSFTQLIQLVPESRIYVSENIQEQQQYILEFCYHLEITLLFAPISRNKRLLVQVASLFEKNSQTYSSGGGQSREMTLREVIYDTFIGHQSNNKRVRCDSEDSLSGTSQYATCRNHIQPKTTSKSKSSTKSSTKTPIKSSTKATSKASTKAPSKSSTKDTSKAFKEALSTVVSRRTTSTPSLNYSLSYSTLTTSPSTDSQDTFNTPTYQPSLYYPQPQISPYEEIETFTNLSNEEILGYLDFPYVYSLPTY